MNVLYTVNEFEYLGYILLNGPYNQLGSSRVDVILTNSC